MTESATLVLVDDDAEVSPPPRGLVSLAEPARHHPTLTIPDIAGLAQLQAYGEVIAESGLYKNVKNWQSAVMLLRYGMQLGVDEHTALSEIYWIENVPTASAKLMTALIERDHGGDWLHPVESTAQACEVQFKRREWREYQTLRVTIEDYRHLADDRRRIPWQTAREDMLWARCISRIARRFFASTIKGLYTPDEIDDARAIETTARVTPRNHQGVTVTEVAPTHDESGPVHQRTRPRGTRQPDNVPPAPPAQPAQGAPDPRPTPKPAAGSRTIVDTWLMNIEKASTLERLDLIAADIVNAKLGDNAALQMALVDRAAQINADLDAS